MGLLKRSRSRSLRKYYCMFENNFEMILGKEITIYHIISNILLMKNAQTQKTVRLK